MKALIAALVLTSSVAMANDPHAAPATPPKDPHAADTMKAPAEGDKGAMAPAEGTHAEDHTKKKDKKKKK